MSAARTPRRATSSEPSKAAIANSAGAMLLSSPTCVALSLNSSRTIAMTGGTARIVSRSALPASQSSASAVHMLAPSVGIAFAHADPGSSTIFIRGFSEAR